MPANWIFRFITSRLYMVCSEEINETKMNNDIILIGHGSGGKLSHELIKEIFLPHFSNPSLDALGDASIIHLGGSQIAITTDSYVIDPLFFPGGDIGQLAVSGTVNDLCVSGAIPQSLSAGFIIEEGFPVDQLKQLIKSMANEAKRAGVCIVAGDTKVVKRGQCDKLFINTSGIGILPGNRAHIGNGNRITPGDAILITGTLGDHAIAILSARENISFGVDIRSDAAPLNLLTERILQEPEKIHFMRDITRGGLATILVESCQKKSFGMLIDESTLPIKEGVRAICELYGFDPLNLANEGKIMLIVKQGHERTILNQLLQDPKGADARIIGEVTSANPGRVVMKSITGGRRIIQMLSGEMIPRIC
jgi:hydrogenase expression/formation protein HypE